MRVEAGNTYITEGGRPVEIETVLTQECPAAIVGTNDDGMVPVRVRIAIGRTPDLQGRLYFFADTGKRVGTRGTATDIATESYE